ncbi:MAG: hypothetical protein H6686_08240 [Fibrobacteria bacterium]|nr:hypothetical protein [Fibrobacteria bacterium]
MSPDRMILVLGANPAWQKIARCTRLQPGEVNRLRSLEICAAGKGMNCAQALVRRGERTLLLGGCGPGETSWEEACGDLGVEAASFPLEGGIRNAITILDETTGLSTELVEEGPSAAHGAEQLVQILLEQRLPNAKALAICGSFPARLDPDCALDAWMRHPAPLVVDSVDFTRRLQLPDGFLRVVVKLNLQEWRSILGEHSPEEVLRQAQSKWPGIEPIATLGSEGSIALDTFGGLLRIPSPAFPGTSVLHPIGAGDAFCAGLTTIIGHEGSLLEAMLEGSAMARASCMHRLPGRFDDAELPRCRDDIHFAMS